MLLEEQLAASRGRCDKLHTLEKDNLLLRAKIHDLEMVRYQNLNLTVLSGSGFPPEPEPEPDGPGCPAGARGRAAAAGGAAGGEPAAGAGPEAEYERVGPSGLGAGAALQEPRRPRLREYGSDRPAWPLLGQLPEPADL